MIRITILGSGTGVPWRGRSSPGWVLQVDVGGKSHVVLVDPSAGSSHRMVAAGYPLEHLTHVLFTHFHPDHVGDLVPILFALKNPRYLGVGADTPLVFAGPRGLVELHRALSEAHGNWIDLGPRARFQELQPNCDQGLLSLGSLEVTCHAVEHTDNSVAFRFESRMGTVFTYSGDTDRCDGIVEAARGADVLLLECAFPEGEKQKGHLTPSEAGQIAAAANVRRLILTHLYPECRGKDLIGPCREHYSGDVELAEDGLTINL